MASFGARSHIFRPPRNKDQLEMRVMAGRQNRPSTTIPTEVHSPRFLAGSDSRKSEHRSALPEAFFRRLCRRCSLGCWRPRLDHDNRHEATASAIWAKLLLIHTLHSDVETSIVAGSDSGVWLRSLSASNSSPCRLATGRGGRRAFLANGDVAEKRVDADARNQR